MHDDAALIRRIADGDERALTELYLRFGDRMSRRLFAMLRCRTEVEEVLQDVFVAIWRRAGDYDPTRASVGAWISVIARCRAVDSLRQRRATVELPGELAIPAGEHLPPDRAIEEEQQRTCVQSGLARLSASDREVLTLAYYGDLSKTEIASRLALPVGTVKSRTIRAMKRLRSHVRTRPAARRRR